MDIDVRDSPILAPSFRQFVAVSDESGCDHVAGFCQAFYAIRSHSIFLLLHFVSSWNPKGAVHWKGIPMFVTIISAAIDHEHRDSLHTQSFFL
jgi:hypothetical protein